MFAGVQVGVVGSESYEWTGDFPLHLQNRQPNGKSSVTLEFGFSSRERALFAKNIGISINDTLPVTLAFGKADVSIDFRKQGPAKKNFEAKAREIVSFITDRLQFDYIPAVRTADSAKEIVDRLVQRELSRVERNPDFARALRQIDALQAPVLDQISTSITATIKQFMPKVQKVEINIRSAARARALRASTEISIDDGVLTRLSSKGDGVQSLAALALMRHASDTRVRFRDSIIAIEEPESHLHPNAIHELRRVVEELSEKNQVVLTTHSPIFVNRNNIVVQETKAIAAARLVDIRDALGVRVSDNLQNAEVVLIVEGDDDRVVLQPYLASQSSLLKDAISNGRLTIDTLGGAGNLSYKAGMYLTSMCKVHCFIDGDKAGQAAFKRACEDTSISQKDANFVVVDGLQEAMLEDVFTIDVHKSAKPAPNGELA